MPRSQDLDDVSCLSAFRLRPDDVRDFVSSFLETVFLVEYAKSSLDDKNVPRSASSGTDEAVSQAKGTFQRFHDAGNDVRHSCRTAGTHATGNIRTCGSLSAVDDNCAQRMRLSSFPFPCPKNQFTAEESHLAPNRNLSDLAMMHSPK